MVDFRDALGRFLKAEEAKQLPQGETVKEFSFSAFTSSAIRAVSWVQKTMTVSFQSGSTYVYFGVPYSEYRDFYNSMSRGSHFYWDVRDEYSYIRVS